MPSKIKEALINHAITGIIAFLGCLIYTRDFGYSLFFGLLGIAVFMLGDIVQKK